MFLAYWPLSPVLTIISIVSLYGLRRTYWELTTGNRRRQLAAKHGCQPLEVVNKLDPFFGLDFVWGSYKAMKDHKGLEYIQKHIAKLGKNTVGARLLGFR